MGEGHILNCGGKLFLLSFLLKIDKKTNQNYRNKTINQDTMTKIQKTVVFLRETRTLKVHDFNIF